MADLLATRKLFRKISGRTDLVDSNGADVGTSTHGLTATLLINTGKDFLEEFYPIHPKSRKWFRKDISQGDVLLTFQKARSIERVWVADADGKEELKLKTMEWIRENYGKEKADIAQGTPSYYTPAVLGLSPEQSAVTSANYTSTFTYDADDLLFPDEQSDFNNYDGILFYPPADQTFTMSIKGLFGEPDLSADTDVNFWSVRYPLTLVYAALHELEASYRNTEGMNDWINRIEKTIQGIDNNAVLHGTAQSGQIAG